MSILLLEGCDLDFYRWKTIGNPVYSNTGGLYDKGSFVFPSSSQKFTNCISNIFKAIEDVNGQRKFRLSFWIKTTGQVSENTEFISLYSDMEEMGGSIGVDKNGCFYVGYLTLNGEWQGIYAEPNPAQPSIFDGNTHFVEFDIHWDTWQGSPIGVWIDGVKYINKIGSNVNTELRVWSRPNTISIGNLIGCDMILDDIILWDDVGDYKGYMGPKKVQISIPKGFGKYEDRTVTLGEKLYETYVSPQAQGGILTIVLSQQKESVSRIRPVVKMGNEYTRGEEMLLIGNTNKTIKMHLNATNINNIWMGIEKDV